MPEGYPGHPFADLAPWALMELGCTNLGDQRRTNRLVQVASALAASPACSVPEACKSWAETKGAYRFLENDEVEPTAILAGHRESALHRLREHPVVLAIQDTTACSFSHHAATRGLGAIGGKGPGQQTPPQGFFVHSCLATTPDGVPLGLLGQEQWVRQEDKVDLEDPGHAPSNTMDKDEKESARWIRMLRNSTQGVPAGTKVITVADREADIYDLFAEASRLRQELLVRSSHNRWLAGGKQRLWTVLNQAGVVGHMGIEVPRSDDRPSRIATLELRTALIHLQNPKVVGKLLLSGVLAREVAPPPGEEPIEWRLLTTLMVSRAEEAANCVRWYARRWLIERFHYTLKSGCRVEELQLETAERLQRAVAIYSVVAWHLMHLTYMARMEPTGRCTTVLSAPEWKTLYCMTWRTSQLPPEPPDLRTAVLWIAKMGGFLGRKRDGNPGVQVLWRGYRRLQDMAEMWSVLRPQG